MKSYVKDKFIGIYVYLCYSVFRRRRSLPRIISIWDTLETILETKKSLARFGDGELHLVSQTENLGFQCRDQLLSERLKEVLVTDNPNCLVGLPPGLVSVDELVPDGRAFWRHFTVFHLKRYLHLIDNTRIYLNSNLTRPYMDYIDKSSVRMFFDRLKELWRGKKILIVEGTMTRLGVGNNLFEGADHTSRIITRANNAFECYSLILDAVVSCAGDYDLVLIALGPTATVLAYDLSKVGIQAIDIGHIDVEYEWFLRGVEKKISIKGKHVNEVVQDIVHEESTNAEYSRQIINKIL